MKPTKTQCWLVLFSSDFQMFVGKEEYHKIEDATLCPHKLPLNCIHILGPNAFGISTEGEK